MLIREKREENAAINCVLSVRLCLTSGSVAVTVATLGIA